MEISSTASSFELVKALTSSKIALDLQPKIDFLFCGNIKFISICFAMLQAHRYICCPIKNTSKPP
jgi:hypothetical protein